MDPSAYSIQDAKLKDEEDRMRSAAELKKKKEREGLEELRKRFVELLHMNENDLPESVRIKRQVKKCFCLDLQIRLY